MTQLTARTRKGEGFLASNRAAVWRFCDLHAERRDEHA
jgi:hypothetical protein